jgi:hypothetical protein
MTTEKWVDIENSEGAYSISSFGRVRSNARSFIKSDGVPHTLQEKILACGVNKRGYVAVCLRVGKQSFTEMVHRLVAKAFIPTVEGKPAINHRNGVKTDNTVGNLEWCTNQENSTHAKYVLKRSFGRKTYNNNSTQ